MSPDLFSEEAPFGSILVSDHLVFAFWVVAYRRFYCLVFFLLKSLMGTARQWSRETYAI